MAPTITIQDVVSGSTLTVDGAERCIPYSRSEHGSTPSLSGEQDGAWTLQEALDAGEEQVYLRDPGTEGDEDGPYWPRSRIVREQSITLCTEMSRTTMDPRGECSEAQFAAAVERYRAQLVRAIEQAYPGASVQVIGRDGARSADVEGFEHASAVEREVAQLAQDTYESGRFWSE